MCPPVTTLYMKRGDMLLMQPLPAHIGVRGPLTMSCQQSWCPLGSQLAGPVFVQVVRSLQPAYPFLLLLSSRTCTGLPCTEAVWPHPLPQANTA